MAGSSTAAERLLGTVFFNLTQRHRSVNTFRRLSEVGRPSVTATLARENNQFTIDLLSDPQYAEVFKDREAFIVAGGGPGGVAATLTSSQLNEFSGTIDSASLVFIHSALDAAVSDLCRVTRLSKPGAWEPFIKDQKVAVSELREKTSDEIMSAKLDAYMDNLDRRSLLERVDRLFMICHPPVGFDPVRGYRYDRERLDSLDTRRHDVVHGTAMSKPIPGIQADIEWLVRTGLYLLKLVNETLGVQMDPLYATGIALNRETPGGNADG